VIEQHVPDQIHAGPILLFKITYDCDARQTVQLVVIRREALLLFSGFARQEVLVGSEEPF
jgi:hypothetical protein